jgi:two-component system sensor histidine kinase SenX3
MRRRKTAIFFTVLGISMIALAIALNVGWILLNVREVALLVLGVVFFALIITGLTLNTIFLLREIRRNEQHDAFLNAVTHELKTPIASIRLYLETLKSRDIEPAKRAEFYDVMLADSDRLLGTVEQVLQASRSREKERRMDLSTFDVGELLTETIEIARQRNHLKDGAIRYTGPADSAEIVGDRTELQTAFMNLLDNAIKYTSDEPKISVRMKVTRLRADIFFRDNGLGLERGDLKRIFKRFYRVGNSPDTKTKGTGLGLSIVTSIIAKHGGSVKAESRGLGEGSTFIVHLPLS